MKALGVRQHAVEVEDDGERRSHPGLCHLNNILTV
jgi:hypothetical protein